MIDALPLPNWYFIVGVGGMILGATVFTLSLRALTRPRRIAKPEPPPDEDDDDPDPDDGGGGESVPITKEADVAADVDEAETCPFCDADAVSQPVAIPGGAGFRVKCERCGATGPLGASEADAISRWNTRE